MPYVLGIDLGTTNSCAAVLEAGEALVIENKEGGRTTPSVVALTEDSEQLIGQVARRQAVTNPENTVYSIKRFMGRKFADEDVQRTRKIVPYHVVSAENGDAFVSLGDKEYAPQEISSMILAKLKADVEARVGEPVTQAVITVPAYFDDAQRQATKDAGRIAGLDVLRIINEPTSAALAYGLGRKTDETIAVYDLGGGTFDISILQLGDNVFEVKSTNGDTRLGGDDFDAAIIEWMIEEFKEEHSIDLHKDRMALQRLKEAAEIAKIELSSLLHTRINLPFIASGPSGPIHLTKLLTRAKLESLTSTLVQATGEPCRQAMLDAGISSDDIDVVVLVGGQTRMPAVQQLVKDIFGKTPSHAVNPDEVVAIGAAVQAGILTGQVENVLLLDVTPLTLGVEVNGGQVAPLIPRNTTVPTVCSEVFTTALDGQDTVDIHITQGERLSAAENRSLARFHLDGIPYAARGVPQIEVTFVLDANGILNVSARDLTTGREQQVTITPSSGLADEDVDRMMTDAATYREVDKVREAEFALQDEVDQLLYQSLNVIRESGDSLDEATKEQLRTAAQTLEKSLAGGDGALIREQAESVRRIVEEAKASL